MSIDGDIERAKVEWLKEIAHNTGRIASALEEGTVCQTPSPTQIERKKEDIVSSHSSIGRFDLKSIQWRNAGGGLADFNESFSWAFVRDLDGRIHPEIERIYREVLRYGEVHQDGWIINMAKTGKELLNKRRAPAK